MKSISDMTKKEFMELPVRKWNEDIGLFDCVIIISGDGRRVHDSGYRFLDFVAIKEDKPICRLSGCSDVLHLDGIGGYGNIDWGKAIGIPEYVPVKAWNFDCLKKSGLLRFWCDGHMLKADPAVSSFSIYAIKINKDEDNNEKVR